MHLAPKKRSIHESPKYSVVTTYYSFHPSHHKHTHKTRQELTHFLEVRKSAVLLFDTHRGPMATVVCTVGVVDRVFFDS
jgi:hypothetical protein